MTVEQVRQAFLEKISKMTLDEKVEEHLAKLAHYRMAAYEMHDQEIMDVLKRLRGDGSVSLFGECLCGRNVQGMPDEATNQEYTKIINGVFHDVQISFIAKKIIKVDDDGYTWLIEAEPSSNYV